MSEILPFPTLQELSIGTIFGVHNREALSQIKQLSTKTIIETAVLIKLKEVNLTKHESALDLEIDDRRLFSSNDRDRLHDYAHGSDRTDIYDKLHALSEWNDSINETIKQYNFLSKRLPKENAPWNNNPMYQVIHDRECTDIVKNYQRKRREILSLPDMPHSLLPTLSREEVLSHYHDPLYFIFHIVPKNSSSLIKIINGAETITLLLISTLKRSLSILEKNRHLLDKKAYIPAKASSIQLNYSLSSLAESLSKMTNVCKTCNNNQNHSPNKIKEMSIQRSLNVIIKMREVDRDFKALKENIIPIMKGVNFVKLEDRIELLKSIPLNSSTSRIIKVTKSSLKSKYHSMIIRKKLRRKQLLKKINLSNDCGSGKNFLEPIFIESVILEARRIRATVLEMERVLRDLP
ncbi:hypothetical protein [Candidatus Ichthyocystis hellenicum]|uniref:hypothetical protein n=1 Tax=Candidatus Ichthyocystis hellenicum TaxID=1561003 RepID=UPI000B82F0F5|nr:hypothetical protein [Candidatus Ichthyocystis hellenicum]